MDPFVAEIRVFGFNFAPIGWAQCNGQLMPISQNTALFSLLGTTYGGDGRSTFGLPNLQGSVPVGMGNGAGLSSRFLGETGGEDSLTLLATEMPQHTHGFKAFVGRGASNVNDPATGDALTTSAGGLAYVASSPTGAALDPRTLAASGGGQPHNNLMPYLTLNFCIALQGVFPARS
jgi:microcystin-dependent protein